jgi:hypothetical protein
MEDLSNGTNGKSAAVYVGWSTFKTCILDGLTHGGVPNTINRTVFPGQSGGVQNQLLTGLKFLGLTDEKGKPTRALHDLTVTDESARKQALAEILRASYRDVFDLDVARTTPKELSDTMVASYNVNGDTREKAVRFFLAAAQYAGIQLSPYLLKANGGNGRKRARRARTAEPTPPAGLPVAATAAAPVSPTDGSQHTVALASGGTVTVIVSMNPFKLSPEDRTFVFGLVDKLRDYENKQIVDVAEDDDDEEEDEDENSFGGRAP